VIAEGGDVLVCRMVVKEVVRSRTEVGTIKNE
jgi:hypothetical protein